MLCATAKAFQTFQVCHCFVIENLDRLVVFTRKQQPSALRINVKSIEVAREARPCYRFHQLQRHRLRIRGYRNGDTGPLL